MDILRVTTANNLRDISSFFFFFYISLVIEIGIEIGIGLGWLIFPGCIDFYFTYYIQLESELLLFSFSFTLDVTNDVTRVAEDR